MASVNSKATTVFYPSRIRGWFVLGLALFLLLLWLAVVVGVAMQPPPKDPPEQPANAGPGAVLALILWPPMFLVGSIGLGILRSRVVIADDVLDLTAQRFSIWFLRPVRHARLAWSNVLGVETFEQTNPLAPDGVQIDYVIHTPQGRFAISNILWPQAAEIAAAVAARTGHEVGDTGDVPATIERAVANRAVDRVGLKLMHGCGLVAMVLCGGICILLPLALFGGLPLVDFAKAALVCSMGFSAGAAMWRWRMKTKV